MCVCVWGGGGGGFCHRTESDLFIYRIDDNAVATLFVVITSLCPVTSNKVEANSVVTLLYLL